MPLLSRRDLWAGLAGAALSRAVIRPALAEEPAALRVRDAERGTEVVLRMADLAALPAERESLSFETMHGPVHHEAEGPLLWQVLLAAKLIDPAKPRQWLGRSLLATGADGFTVALALGEIAPAFEGKKVLIALRLDGQTLAPGHLRLAVTGDRRGGRNVHDLSVITLR